MKLIAKYKNYFPIFMLLKFVGFILSYFFVWIIFTNIFLRLCIIRYTGTCKLRITQMFFKEILANMIPFLLIINWQFPKQRRKGIMHIEHLIICKLMQNSELNDSGIKLRKRGFLKTYFVYLFWSFELGSVCRIVQTGLKFMIFLP